MKNLIYRICFVFLLCSSMSACGMYRMPSDDDLAEVPTTNNPDVVDDKGSLMMPGFAL